MPALEDLAKDAEGRLILVDLAFIEQSLKILTQNRIRVIAPIRASILRRLDQSPVDAHTRVHAALALPGFAGITVTRHYLCVLVFAFLVLLGNMMR